MTVRLIAHGTIHDQAGFATTVRSMAEHVSGESGTLAYEWFVSQDAASFVVHEIYRDAEAYASHVESLTSSGDLATFREFVTLDSVEILEGADPQVREVADRFSSRYYEPFDLA